MAERTRTRETRQRRVVYDTIKGTHSHPTADWIFEQVRTEVPKISLGTVYRNLSVLKEEGVIREIYGATEGMFGQQRDDKKAWVPNYDLFFFEVQARSTSSGRASPLS